MYMFFSKKISIILVIFVALGSLVSASSAYAAERFLTLPLEGSLRMWQGWHYGGGSDHEAVDYACQIGAPVYAAAAGIAMQSTQNPNGFGYGNFVFILHDNGYGTLYAHLSRGESRIPAYAQEQQANTLYDEWVRVEQGEVIGYCGDSGTSSSHLHFEVSETGLYARGRVDPYDLYTTADAYPPGSGAEEMGPDHLWLTDPPTFFGESVPDDIVDVPEDVIEVPEEVVVEEVVAPNNLRQQYLSQSFFRYLRNPSHTGRQHTGVLYSVCESDTTSVSDQERAESGRKAYGGGHHGYTYCIQ